MKFQAEFRVDFTVGFRVNFQRDSGCNSAWIPGGVPPGLFSSFAYFASIYAWFPGGFRVDINFGYVCPFWQSPPGNIQFIPAILRAYLFVRDWPNFFFDTDSIYNDTLLLEIYLRYIFFQFYCIYFKVLYVFCINIFIAKLIIIV